MLYGPGGIGKTSLAVTAPGPVAVFDLDGSLPVLQSQLPTETREGIRTVAAPTWSAMLNALHAPGWESIRTIVVDTATLGEQLATRHVLATIPHEKTKQRVTRLEDYPFGKGYSFVFDVFAELLNALDAHARAGRHAVLVCHDCVTNCPNPAGQDWLRYEPRLQSPPSGKASIRLRVREWADHVLFVGYDINVAEGKGQGSGTRTIYPAELPHCMAKSRVLAEPIPLVKFDQTLWQLLLTL
ncbi:MAG: AAA family ATPase [Phycisphaerae bacterium]|nr:AAA family ATPase [Phycisphaerae bacterium]